MILGTSKNIQACEMKTKNHQLNIPSCASSFSTSVVNNWQKVLTIYSESQGHVSYKRDYEEIRMTERS